jgi:hypothetical protein
VFVNPYGGKRQARRIWSKLAEPILTAAGVSCDLVETQRMVGPVRVCGIVMWMNGGEGGHKGYTCGYVRTNPSSGREQRDPLQGLQGIYITVGENQRQVHRGLHTVSWFAAWSAKERLAQQPAAHKQGRYA